MSVEPSCTGVNPMVTIPAASPRSCYQQPRIRVLPAEFLVGIDLDNFAVIVQHGAICDLAPAVAIDRMRSPWRDRRSAMRASQASSVSYWRLASGSL
jgi:hypothetical protein